MGARTPDMVNAGFQTARFQKAYDTMQLTEINCFIP